MYYEELLHYFRNENFTNTIQDEITGIVGSGTKRWDFIGYNIIALKKKEEMIQKPFDYCNNLISYNIIKDRLYNFYCFIFA